jgi:hypothetical protein
VNIRNWVLAAALICLAACSRGNDDQPITYDGHVVEVHGWKGPAPAAWDKVLEVYANASPGSPPMLGDYERHGSTIDFKPRFKPSPAVSLYVVYHRPDGTIASSLFPAKSGYKAPSITKVVQVYPTADTWPANTLKLYIQFSGPMKEGVAWSHIHLLDEAGQPIKQPFVEIDQELWDPAGARLTVLFDPGRIKRGLVDNATEGPPLVAGHKYTLRVDKDWPDAAGAPLTDGFEKSITAGPDVRVPVETSAWKVTAPARNQALDITFPRPMDNALARSAITVRKDNVKVPGKVILDNHETHWVFVPDHVWAPGSYQIHVEGTAAGVADLAGNLLGRLFDMDKSDPKQAAAGDGPPSADLPFKVS